LLENNADVNCSTTRTQSFPLGIAAQKGNIDICKLLLVYGAEPFAADHYGYTALDIISNRISAEARSALEKLLHNHKRDPDIALYNAITLNQPRLVLQALEDGANIHYRHLSSQRYD
jgi:ankyrin repeat protein